MMLPVKDWNVNNVERQAGFGELFVFGHLKSAPPVIGTKTGHTYPYNNVGFRSQYRSNNKRIEGRFYYR